MDTSVRYGILLIILSLAFRLLYASYQPRPILNADSYGYYGIGKRIADHPALSTIINQYRVPVYPMVLGGLMLLNDARTVPLDDPGVLPVLEQLVFIQSGLQVAGMLLVYLLLLEVSLPAVWAFFISLFFSLNIYTVPLERAVMTDSLAGTFLIVLTYLLVQLVRTPTTRTYVLFGILSAVSWLLRPNLLLVSLLSLPLLLFVKTNRKFIRTNMVVFGVSLLLPIVFVSLNSRFHGYTGISQATEIALLGRILEFTIPVEAGRQYETYYGSVVDYRKKNGEPLPFQFIDRYMPLAYVDTGLMTELQRFNRAVIAANAPSYIIGVFSYIPNIFADGPPLRAIDTTATGGIAGLFAVIWQTYRGVWQAGYLVFVLWPVSVWLYVRKRSILGMIPVLFGTICVSQLMVIVFFDYYEIGQYARLASAIQPQAFLFLGSMAWVYVLRRRSGSG